MPDHPDPQVVKGERAMHFLVGEVLKLVPRANPRVVRELLEERLFPPTKEDFIYGAELTSFAYRLRARHTAWATREGYEEIRALVQTAADAVSALEEHVYAHRGLVEEAFT